MKMHAPASRHSIHVALLLSLAFATVASAAERVPVASVKPLLLAALERGEAHGELIGDAASFMRGRFGSTAPIEIDVRAIGQLRQAGCQRLEVTTRQDAVREARDQPSTRKELVYQVSYCRDGRFPEVK